MSAQRNTNNIQKIYSRNPMRFWLHKHPEGRRSYAGGKKNKKKIVKLIAVATVSFIMAKNIILAINPIVTAQCINEAKIIATTIVNKHTSKVMNMFKYEDIAQVMKDDNGRIQMIKLNVIPVNKIITEISNNIQNELNDVDNAKIRIRIGSFLGGKLLSGVGPKIGIKLATDGNVEINLKSEFINAGINQTMHQIYLEIKCRVIIYSPYETISEELTNKVVIAESIIVGEIPNNYYNLKK